MLTKIQVMMSRMLQVGRLGKNTHNVMQHGAGNDHLTSSPAVKRNKHSSSEFVWRSSNSTQHSHLC